MLSTERKTVIPTWPPSTPRLQWKPPSARPTLLDGGWWPRSTNPVAELPGLIVALDECHGRPITRLMLTAAGWDSHPARIGVADRTVRLGWFTSLPNGLLTATCHNGDRIDLLVVPPGATPASAATAMAAAADATNTLHAPDILTAVTGHHMATADPDADSLKQH